MQNFWVHGICFAITMIQYCIYMVIVYSDNYCVTVTCFKYFLFCDPYMKYWLATGRPS